jgi:hypothetical protein
MPEEERWRELYSYWLSKHVDGRPPSRRDIDPPVDIARLAPNLMLLDVEGTTYRYRVVGTEIEARAKMSLAGSLVGMPGTLPQVVADWHRALDAARDDQKAHLYYSRLPQHIVAKFVTIVLPLIDEAGRTEKILVGSFYDQYVEPGTRVLGMVPVEITL